MSECETHDEGNWLNVNVKWIRSFSGSWQSLTSSCSWSSLASVWVAAPGSPGGSRACRCRTAQASVDPGSSCRCHSCRGGKAALRCATPFIIFTLQNFRMYSRLRHTRAKMVDDCTFFPTTSSLEPPMACASPVEDCWQAGRLPWRFTLLFAGLPLFGGF